MSAIAYRVARICWYWMLCVMRQPWMKGLQQAWLRRVPEHRRAEAWASVVKQNRFARRYGLGMLTASISLFFASAIITVLYYAAILLLTSGVLDPPERLEASGTSYRSQPLQSPR